MAEEETTNIGDEDMLNQMREWYSKNSDPNTVIGSYESSPEVILSFQEEIRWVINKCAKENDSDTPDFILAQYLIDCINAYAKAVRSRDNHFDYEPWSGGTDDDEDELSPVGDEDDATD